MTVMVGGQLLQRKQVRIDPEFAEQLRRPQPMSRYRIG
jgi:hypothetical protein